MRRKRSAPSLKSDSGPEDFVEISYDDDDQASSIFMADATSSGNSSDLEKDTTTSTPNEYDHEGDAEDVTEESSLLAANRASNMYGGITSKDTGSYNKNSYGGHSLPSIVYASPARPHLPSPSASNSRATGIPLFERVVHRIVTPGMYLPYNWRTPAMVAYDVQAHPFNRAPNASPQMTINRTRHNAPQSDTEATGGSSRSSVWSVELEHGSCGCLSGYTASRRNF